MNLKLNCDSFKQNTKLPDSINHINIIVEPQSKSVHPNKIIFVTADAFG